MIFYYTATGNSLYVAKRLSDNLLSIPQLMKQDELVFEDETIGIVCPQKAIKLARENNANARYLKSGITLAEVIKSNNQH